MERTRQARAHHLPFKDEDMSSTLSPSPRDRQARRYATGLALIATLGPFFYGFEGMVLNAAIKAVGSTFELGPILQGVAGAAGVIGGLIGALGAGRISDRIGRKTTLMWVGPFLLVEALLGPLSPLLGSLGYPFLILTRIIGGIGFGAATTVAPGYVAEIAPAEIRGRLFACLIIPALLFVIFTARIPESPRYLVSAGRRQEAEAVLAKLCGEEDPAVRVEAIAQSLAITGGAKLSIGQILSSQWRGLVFIGMAIAAFQQLTGINGVFFYSNSLFAAVGFTESMALAQTLLITAFKIVGVLVGIMAVDRVGRKRMLIYGGTLIFVSLGVVATVFTIAPTVDGKPDVADSPVLAFLAVAALCTFLLGFTSSWGPIFSIVMGEMFPNSIRGGAMSLASGADFLVNFLVVLLFPFLIAWSPAGTYWIYCAFGILAVAFTAKFLTETSGTELEDMDKVVSR